MFKQIIDFFKQQQWQYTIVENKTIALFGISGEKVNFQCMADVREEDAEFIFFSICGVKVPENRRSEVSELLTRINFGIFLGNFEMDFEDGEIRFKVSIYFEESQLSFKTIENLILRNISTMDSYVDSIIRMIYGNYSAIEAYKNIENSEVE